MSQPSIFANTRPNRQRKGGATAKKAKYPPLTGDELALAKGMNCWWYERKKFQLPSDVAGKYYTKKNLGDIADLYLLERHGLVFLDGSSVERDELVTLMYRYRAKKSAEKRVVNNKRALRVLSRRLKAIGIALKQKQKDAEQAKKREQASRQGSFNFAGGRP